jgi:hypothetical protein
MNNLSHNKNDPLILECKELFKHYKTRILSNIESIDIDFETGFAYKKMIETRFNDLYWTNVYYFLKGLAHFHNVKTFR